MAATSLGRSIGWVGACVIVSGLLLNVYLAIVARGLSPAEYSHFGAFWSLALVIGFGLFLPIEQELARLLHHRRAASVLRGALPIALTAALLEFGIVLAATPWLLDAFGGRIATLAALAVLCFVSAAQFLVRGLLIGTNRLRAYGLTMVVDTMLRVILAMVVWSVLPTNSAYFAWTLVIAIAIAHVPVLIGPLKERGSRQPAPEPPPSIEFTRSIGPLLAGSIGGQVLLNGLPVIVAAMATAVEQDAAGRFAAAFFLARIPLFVVVPMQTALVPVLTQLLNSEQGIARVAKILTGFAVVLALMVAAGIVVSFTFGPYLVQIIFGQAYAIESLDLALMATGVVLHIGLIIGTQALVAADLHVKVAWSWLCGVCAAVIAFALVPDLLLRAELAFLIGSAVGWLTAMSCLMRETIGSASVSGKA